MGFTAQTYLRHLCEEGLEKRYGARKNDPVIRERLDFELNVIHTMGFDSYFLIVWDLCRHARENGIWYNTRGSGAGSLVAYSLFITLVDPIEHQLLFERFLNPGRISMPDIDLDFRDDRRAEMLVYAARKYGDDRVAQIITFGTMAARGALRDVGRVLEMPIPEVDKVAKLVPQIPGKPITLTQALEEVPDLKALYDPDPKVKKAGGYCHPHGRHCPQCRHARRRAGHLGTSPSPNICRFTAPPAARKNRPSRPLPSSKWAFWKVWACSRWIFSAFPR